VWQAKHSKVLLGYVTFNINSLHGVFIGYIIAVIAI